MNEYYIYSYVDEHRSHTSIKQSSIITELYKYDNCLQRQSINTNNIRLTILLLFVSCSFLLLTLPAVVFNLIMSIKLETRSTNFNNHLKTTNKNLITHTEPYYTLARFLMILNHSINFILYFVVGKRFRRDLKNLFSDSWRKLYRQRDTY
jgi:hypothetical protein